MTLFSIIPQPPYKRRDLRILIIMRLTAILGQVVKIGIKVICYTLALLIVFLFIYERIKLNSNMTDFVENNALLNNLKSSGRFVKPSASVLNRAAPGTSSNSFDPIVGSGSGGGGGGGSVGGAGGNLGKKRQKEEKGIEARKEEGEVVEEEEEEEEEGEEEEDLGEDFGGDLDGGGGEEEDFNPSESGKPSILKGILRSQPPTNEHQPMNLEIAEEATTASTPRNAGKRKKKSLGTAGNGEKDCVGCQGASHPAKKRAKKNSTQHNGAITPQTEILPQTQTQTAVNGDTAAICGAVNGKCTSCVALQKCIKGLLKTVENFVVPSC